MEGGAARSIEGVRRKLRAVAAVLADRGATPHERVNAAALKARLERRLEAAGEPAGDWTDGIFRLGRLARTLERSTAPRSASTAATARNLRRTASIDRVAPPSMLTPLR